MEPDMKESNMPRADFITSIFLTVFGIGVLWASVAMPRFEDQGGSFYDSPGIVPGIMGVLITGFSVYLLIRSIRRRGWQLGLNGRAVGAVLKDESTLRMLITIAAGVIYGLVLLRFLHFIASTLIFVFAFIVLFEYDRKKSIASQWKTILFAVLVSVLTTGAVYGAFQYLFLVNLP
jgi:hypothetical protein